MLDSIHNGEINQPKRLPCLNPDWGGGKEVIKNGRRIMVYCKNKNCLRHWKPNFARPKLREFKRKLMGWNSWHVRIAPLIPAEPGKQANYLSLFIKAIQTLHPEARIWWIKHQGRPNVHFHLLVQIPGLLDEDGVRAAWAKHRPAKRRIRWSGRSIYIKKRPNAEALLVYLLGLSHRPKRIRPPWHGLDGPVAVYKKPKFRADFDPDATVL